MKKCTVSLLLILTVTLLFSNEQLEFSVTGSIGRMFGQTSYKMEENGSGLGVMSFLEFPLGSTVAILNLDLEKHIKSGIPWAIHASFKTNIDDPNEVMKDSDWYLYKNYPPIYFSYTESEAQMRFIQAEVSFDKKLYSWKFFEFYATAGYQYQYVNYDIMGYKGWQYRNQDKYENFKLYVSSVNSDLKVLEYKITHHAPMAGIMIHANTLSTYVSLSLNYLLVFISDYDDHVLRSKLSTAEGIGHGLSCSLEGRYNIKHKQGSFMQSIFLATSFSYIYADIDQTQKWYENLDQAPEGTIYTGISHIIESTLFSCALGIRLSY